MVLTLLRQVGVIALSLSGEVVDTEFVMRIMGESTRLQYGVCRLPPFISWLMRTYHEIP